MQYAIIPLDEARDAEEDERLRQAIQVLDPKAYSHYDPHFYLLSYAGTTEELALELGFSAKSKKSKDGLSPLTGIVLRVTHYYGHASPGIWEWLETRREG